MNRVLGRLDTGMDRLFSNQYVISIVSLLLALYAGAVAPALPNAVIRLFDTIPGKVIFAFLIAFLASRNSQLAIMVSLAFVVTLYGSKRGFREGFEGEEEELDEQEEQEEEEEEQEDEEEEEEEEDKPKKKPETKEVDEDEEEVVEEFSGYGGVMPSFDITSNLSNLYAPIF